MRLLAAGGSERRYERGDDAIVSTVIPAAAHGKRIIVDGDRTAWVEEPGSARAPVKLAADPQFVYRAAFSPDGKRAALSYDAEVRLFDSATGAQLAPPLRHKYQSRPCATFSRDGRQIVTVDYPLARVWDVAKGTQTAQFGGDKREAVQCSAFTPDGAKVATIGSNGSIRLWNAATGEELVRYEGASDTTTVQFSRTGARLLTAHHKDRNTRVWDTDSGIEIARMMPIETYPPFADDAVFSADETRIVTTTDQHVFVWAAYPGISELVRDAKLTVSRCLTPEERAQFHLSATPPRWCYAMKKWPYHTAEPPPISFAERALMMWNAIGRSPGQGPAGIRN
jgi:WD40 repeat protein